MWALEPSRFAQQVVGVGALALRTASCRLRPSYGRIAAQGRPGGRPFESIARLTEGGGRRCLWQGSVKLPATRRQPDRLPSRPPRCRTDRRTSPAARLRRAARKSSAEPLKASGPPTCPGRGPGSGRPPAQGRANTRADRGCGRWTGGEGRSDGGFGVSGACVGDPGGAVGVVDQVPDAAAAGDLVLPALQRLSLPDRSAELALEVVVALGVVRGPRGGSDLVEGAAEVACGVAGEVVPAVGRLGVGEAQVEFVADRGWGRAVTALGAHSAVSPSGTGTGPRSPSGSRVRKSCRAGSA